jgi:poly(A) polymerase Pap1
MMPSDHYGIRCELAFTTPTIDDGKSSAAVTGSGASMAASAMLLPDTDFDKLLAEIGTVETARGDAARTAAMIKLEQCLPPIFAKEAVGGDAKVESKDDVKLFKLYTIGSVAMGIHSPSSDIDAICVGGQDRGDFFKFAQRVIASTSIPGVKLKQVLAEDVLVPVVKLVIDGIHIDLQYCRLPNRTTFDRYMLLLCSPAPWISFFLFHMS